MYYINPWVFYIVSLISNIQFVSVLFVFIGGFLFLIAIIAGPALIDEATDTKEEEDRYKAVFWKWMKRLPLVWIISLVIAITVPSEETMYKMLIASKISSDEVDHVIERLDDVVDSIIESKEQADDSAD